MATYKNNRSARRFPIFYAVEIEDDTGITRDLSTSGFCFTTDKALPLASMLRCVILRQKKDGKIIRLRCEGQVVRTTQNAEGWDIAVKFTSFEW